jgi:hypothetical protein
MATTVDNNLEYCGKDAAELYASAILEGESISKVRQFLNVKNTLKVRNIETGSRVLQEMDCEFTPNGTVDLTEKTLTTCDLKINMELCVKDFDESYISDMNRPGHNTGEVAPPSIVEYILKRQLEHVGINVENLFWQGDVNGSLYNECDGMIKGLEADANVIDINAIGITPSNVTTEFDRLIDAAPVVMQLKKDGKGEFRAKIMVSANIVQAYKRFQAQLGYGTAYNGIGDKQLNYMGYDVVYAPGLLNNQMLFVDPQNLWFGTDLITDITDLIVIDMFKTLGTPTIRIVGGFKFGVNHGVGSEIVLYN